MASRAQHRNTGQNLLGSLTQWELLMSSMVLLAVSGCRRLAQLRPERLIPSLHGGSCMQRGVHRFEVQVEEEIIPGTFHVIHGRGEALTEGCSGCGPMSHLSGARLQKVHDQLEAALELCYCRARRVSCAAPPLEHLPSSLQPHPEGTQTGPCLGSLRVVGGVSLTPIQAGRKQGPCELERRLL